MNIFTEVNETDEEPYMTWRYGRVLFSLPATGTVVEADIVFHYSGGENILCYVDGFSEQVKPELFSVWDYEQGRARISTLQEFRAACLEWFESDGDDDEEVDR